jgi:hypothetical protein
MNLEITSRQRPDRRGFIGSSGRHLIVSADQAGLIRLWKEEHGESKSRRARSRVRIAAARRKSTTPKFHPVSSAVCWLFKLFVFFQSRFVQPDADPTSGFGDKGQSSGLHQGPQSLDCAQQRGSMS